MRTRPLIPTVIVCLVVLALCNLATVPWSRRLWYHERLDDIEAAQNPDIVFVGNSLMDARIDTNALNTGAAAADGTTFRPLNAALGASAPVDQALMMHYAVDLHPGLRTLVVGFFDFQLTEDVHLRPMELTGTHMIAVDPRFPVSEVAPIYHLDRTEQAQLRLLRAFPLAANRMNAWKYVELLRRRLGDMGATAHATNDMGRVEDFAALEAGSDADFDRQAHDFLQNPTHFSASYERVFADAARHNMKVVLVAMPASPAHSERFYTRASWSAYFARIRALAEQRGFIVIDATSWMPRQDEFSDVLHMTFPASSEFSYRLGKELATALP
ncbi:MAG TPA: hypothetical protein VGN16_25610 [Acidobacteriaceae bacterium]|jgi:hypothetical protein